MLSVFDGLRDVTTLSVFVRLACALICGGIIGIERSYKRRPAGSARTSSSASARPSPR